MTGAGYSQKEGVPGRDERDPGGAKVGSDKLTIGLESYSPWNWVSNQKRFTMKLIYLNLNQKCFGINPIRI